MFFYSRKTSFDVEFKLGDAVSNTTKSYKYIGYIICDNLSDENYINPKKGSSLYSRSDILLITFYFCSKKVKNKLFASYCSDVHVFMFHMG